jgi:hypothetical protein
MPRLTDRPRLSAIRRRISRKTKAMPAALALSVTLALAMTIGAARANGHVTKAERPTSGGAPPAWVIRDCRPATGVEILSRFAGPGFWFYRETGDFCYFDRRPGVM